MANTYFIKITTWGTDMPQIIDEETLQQAERGGNYLNPDDYDFLCEADCIEDAEDYYSEALSDEIFSRIAERDHP